MRRFWFAFSLAAAALWIAVASRGQTAPAEGQGLFERRCGGCHALDRDKEGPRLGGVVGRAAGAVDSFPYSDALKQSRLKWDAATLDQWLADPAALVPGNDMPFRLAKAEERRAIIAYLQQVSAR